jgi:methionyl-tRNA formyltransferase
MKIVFMGTPDFAVGILDKLISEKCNVVGVVTAPDKPAGRGQQLSESSVKKYGIEKGLTILQPTNLKEESFISELQGLNADLFVVVAFRMLPEIVWQMPSKGTINLHASLLPKYRGAAPINWAIMNGEKTTGVTTFFIEKEIDTGLVIERRSIEIEENETAGELHDKLMNLGKELIYSSVLKIENNEVIKIPQEKLIENDELKSAPKIFKPMCEINWDKPVDQVHNFCRGLSPYPTAWTKFKNNKTGEIKSVKIFKTEKTIIESKNVSIYSENSFLYIKCKDFYLKVLELQLEGKRKMSSKDFLIGNNSLDFEI